MLAEVPSGALPVSKIFKKSAGRRRTRWQKRKQLYFSAANADTNQRSGRGSARPAAPGILWWKGWQNRFPRLRLPEAVSPAQSQPEVWPAETGLFRSHAEKPVRDELETRIGRNTRGWGLNHVLGGGAVKVPSSWWEETPESGNPRFFCRSAEIWQRGGRRFSTFPERSP